VPPKYLIEQQRCGRRFTETVREQDPKAIEELIRILSGNSTGSTPTHNAISHTEAPQDTKDQPEQGTLPSSNDTRSGSSSQRQGAQGPSRNNGTETQSNHHCTSGCQNPKGENSQGSNGHRGFALLCFKVRKNKILLKQINQKEIHDDKDMFEQFRLEYKKKRWRYWIRLMKLEKIEFKKVSRCPVNGTLVRTNSFSSASATQLKMRVEIPLTQLGLKTTRNSPGLIAECQQDVMINAPMNPMDAESTISHHHRL